MKEKPILFTGPMVRALLDGQKTQTRRMVKPQPSEIAGLYWNDGWYMPPGEPADVPKAQCPYPIGTRLWVKETWARLPCNSEEPCLDCQNCRDGRVFRADDPGRELPVKWRPSIYMPYWASRIMLEVTSVLVERLQDISEQDAEEEGCRQGIEITPGRIPKGQVGHRTGYGRSFKAGYKRLWDSINGKTHPWKSNPWVWVYTFKPISPPQAAR